MNIHSPNDRLLARVKLYQSSSIGFSIEDIGKMPLTPEVAGDIMTCLRSSDVTELKSGLWFAQGVLDSSPPQELLRYLVVQLPNWMFHQNDAVRERSLPLLLRLRDNFPNYPSMMLECLKDTDPEVRTNALAAYSTFLTDKDIPVLLEFERDDYVSETSMNGPLVYLIRNQALEIIERLCRQKFPKHENVKSLEDGHTVYWWDWKPFVNWWAQPQNKWRP